MILLLGWLAFLGASLAFLRWNDRRIDPPVDHAVKRSHRRPLLPVGTRSWS